MTTTRVLVTGATDGIGRQTALDLARRGASVVVHGRSAEKLTEVAGAIRREVTGAHVETVLGDLGSLASVRALGDEVLRRFTRLDALVNNAGVFLRSRTLTVDGFETTFAVNHLAPFLLTHLLRPVLEASGGRVVMVSSGVHGRATMPFDNLQGERSYDGHEAYARSKLANVLTAVELARRWGPAVTVNALHPGVVTTRLLKEGFGMTKGYDSLEDGAATSVYLALSPEVASVTGAYFVASRRSEPNPLARDADLARRFYELSARLVGLGGSN